MWSFYSGMCLQYDWLSRPSTSKCFENLLCNGQYRKYYRKYLYKSKYVLFLSNVICWIKKKSTYFPDLQSLSHTLPMSCQSPLNHLPCVGWQWNPHLQNRLAMHFKSSYCRFSTGIREAFFSHSLLKVAVLLVPPLQLSIHKAQTSCALFDNPLLWPPGLTSFCLLLLDGKTRMTADTSPCECTCLSIAAHT